MKVVILAGGKGSRLGRMTETIPKPMIRINGQPLLWHIMSIYAQHGFDDFVIAGGYRIHVIDKWLNKAALPWKVDLVDTGLETKTGSRVAQVAKYFTEPFFMTYGDGLSNIDINAELAFHQRHVTVCTAADVHPQPRFGRFDVAGDYATSFNEKATEETWINGGFYILEPSSVQEIRPDEAWESGALCRLTARNLVTVYRHAGFWACADTPRDVEYLRDLWRTGGAPWIGQISG